jgi:hypothetical protein
MPQAQPAADLLRPGLHRRRPVDLRDIARRVVDERPEMLPEQLVRMEAGQAFRGV